MILNLGCGRAKALPPWAPISGEVLHVDALASVGPDLVCRLGEEPLNLGGETVDAVYAMHVLEHIGHVGEMRGWFDFWADLYRVCRPNALIFFECPYHTSLWAWADPTHCRPISEFTFLYLNQASYQQGGAIPDYRPLCDFELVWFSLIQDTQPRVHQQEAVSFIRGILRAKKPFQPYWAEAA